MYRTLLPVYSGHDVSSRRIQADDNCYVLIGIPEIKRPFCINIVTYQPTARQRLSIHIPGNTQQWELCYLWTMLQLLVR
jgi:hypothetical protein